MKKLILSLTLIALLTASLGGAAFAQSQQEPLPEVTTETAQGSAPAQADASQSMYPAVHALVMAMTENHLDYDTEDPEFLWTSLYYMLSLYGEMDERSELTDDTLILPSEVVQDYAAALYPDVATLPEIPAPISERISYRASDGTYRLARGDEGLSQVTVEPPIYLSSGPVVMNGALKSLEDGSDLRKFQVTLAARDCMFGYIITDLTFSD